MSAYVYMLRVTCVHKCVRVMCVYVYMLRVPRVSTSVSLSRVYLLLCCGAVCTVFVSRAVCTYGKSWGPGGL